MATIIGRVFESVKNIYSEINPATLTGAIDVIIVRQKDGSYQCSPFHVRFGKMGVLRSKEKVVDIEVNGEPVDIHMKLGESGEAFFVEDIPAAEECPAHLATSPLPPDNMPLGTFDQPIRSEAFRTRASSESCAHERSVRFRKRNEARTDGDVLLPSELETYNFEPSTRVTILSQIKEVPSESLKVALKGSLMGMRDEGGLLDDLIQQDSPAVIGDSIRVFKAETVQAGKIQGPFKPIQIEESPAPSVGDQGDAKKAVVKRRKKKRSTKKRQQRFRPKQNSISSSEDAQEPSPTNSDTSEETLLIDDEEMEKESSPEVENGKVQEEAEALRPATPVLPLQVESRVTDWSSLSRGGGKDFHFFSDTEIYSPNISRPGTPVVSDTEYEKQAASQERPSIAQSEQPSWNWGELPSTTPRSTPLRSLVTESEAHQAKGSGEGVNDAAIENKKDDQAHAHRSMLSSMFSFVRQTKKIRHEALAAGGVYLDDLNLNEMDPEVAAIYFPNAQETQNQRLHERVAPKDDDVESGTGPSLPHSPSSSYGFFERPAGVDSDSEEGRHHDRPRTQFDVAMSLCGGLEDLLEPPEDLFLQSMITFDDLAENPKIVDNQALVIRVGSKYYNRAAAIPILMSLISFQRPLPQAVTDNLVYENMTKPREEKKKLEQQKSRSWFLWGRGAAEPKKSDSEAAFVKKTETERGTESGREGSLMSMSTDDLRANQDSDTASKSPEKLPLSTRNINLERLVIEARSGNSSETESDDPSQKKSSDLRNEKCKKSLRLTSAQIARLNLQEGANEVDFSVTTAYQGTSRCKCFIYLWNWDDKVVISDIDGTITKSDVLGHILPIVGRTWAQSGVTQLFTKICENGYRILYLSARAIGQAQITRDYLKSLKQGDLALPDGPVLLNPTSLISALHREVIERKPEEFKIACLKDIQALFPTESNPFYAGYGNRVNDVWAYTAVGINLQRIFTINPKGELKRGEFSQAFNSSHSNYISQSTLVDLVFPPLHRSGNLAHACAEFSHFNYWKDPVVEIDLDIIEAASGSKSGKK